jgi:excisionase family DNA binding protein
MKSIESSGHALVISVEEAGRRLNLSRNTAYEAVKRGDIPSVKIGRRVLVPIVALEQLLSGGRKAD